MSEQSDTVRLEAFSDGVFAIAITLLVLEIRVPGRPDVAGHGGLVGALAHLWPSYLGFLISFVTIGIMWANHHSIFQYIRRVDRYFLIINILFLMWIAFLPFPTAVLAQHLRDPDTRQSAVAVFSATFVLIAVGFNSLWWYGAGRERLLGHAVDRRGVQSISRRYAVGPVAYLTALGLAFVNVWASLAVHGVLAAFYLFPERRSNPAK